MIGIFTMIANRQCVVEYPRDNRERGNRARKQSIHCPYLCFRLGTRGIMTKVSQNSFGMGFGGNNRRDIMKIF